MIPEKRKKPSRVFSAYGSLDKAVRNWKYLPNVKQSCGASPRGEELVYRLNQTVLEVGQGASTFRGYLGLALGAALATGTFGLGTMLYFFAKSGVRKMTEDVELWVLVLTAIGAGVLLLGLVWSALMFINDFFGYVDAPLRFDRVRRKVYIWANRKGGIRPMELDWDEIKPVAQSATAAPHQFNAFRSVLLVDEEANGDVRFEERLPRIGQIGAAVLDREHTLAAYEFVRVFMERGPQALPPVKEHLTLRVGPRSFVDIFGLIKGTMRDWPKRPEHERKRMIGWLIAGVAIVTVFAWVLWPLQLAQGIALRTTRIPKWPAAYESMAAEGGPLAPPPGSVSNDLPMLAHEKAIAALWVGAATAVYISIVWKVFV